MSKNISVEAHVKRYEQTELQDVAMLIAGLTQLIERRKEEAITDLEQKLAQLKKGEIPETIIPEKPVRTRGGKKKVEETES